MNDKVPCSSTKLIRGGTAYSSSPFELNPQLHGQVSNPYSFGIKQNYKSSATTKVSVPPYTEKSWTTAGTYTFTVPSGVTRIRVAVCGGGGRSACGYHGTSFTGDPGGDSSFDSLLVATGGKGGTDRFLNTHGQGYRYERIPGKAGTPNGKDGSITGWELGFESNIGTYGSGGNDNYPYSTPDYNSKGGSGGYNTNYVFVTPNSNIIIKVGTGGIRRYDSNTAYIPSSGNSGFVLIAYGEGIE